MADGVNFGCGVWLFLLLLLVCSTGAESLITVKFICYAYVSIGYGGEYFHPFVWFRNSVFNATDVASSVSL